MVGPCAGGHTWCRGQLHAAATASSSVCSSRSLCLQPGGSQPHLYCPPGQAVHLGKGAAAQICQARRTVVKVRSFFALIPVNNVRHKPEAFGGGGGGKACLDTARDGTDYLGSPSFTAWQSLLSSLDIFRSMSSVFRPKSIY